jgi:hypothetical protein
MTSVSTERFEQLAEGLSDREIIQAAVDAGLLPRRDFKKGEEILVPLWLAKILQEKGAVDIIDRAVEARA